MRLIIEIDEETYKNVRFYGTYLCPRDEKELVRALKNATPIEERPKATWIPCSERLPTLADGKDVLVNAISDDRVCDIILASVETVETVYRKGWINAWMPLPPSYRGDENETNQRR